MLWGWGATLGATVGCRAKIIAATRTHAGATKAFPKEECREGASGQDIYRA
jgi:hypothetical protein